MAFYAIAFIVKPIAGVLRFGQLRFLRPYFAALREGLHAPVSQVSSP